MMKWSLHEGSLVSCLNCFRRTVPPKSGKVLTSIKSHGKLKLGSWMAPFRKCPLDPSAFLQPQGITFVLFLKTSCPSSRDELWICFLFYFMLPAIFFNFYRSMKTKCRINGRKCRINGRSGLHCSPLLPCSFVIRWNSAILTWRLLNTVTHIFHGANTRKRDSLFNYFNCTG